MTYATIPHMWRVFENIFVERRYYTYRNCLTFDRDRILLPNGMRLMYPNLRIEQGQLTYNTMRGQETTWGGRLTENAVQALSRIIITDAMDKIRRELPESDSPTVHDEVVM